jgi:hypothetical protein
MAGRPVAPSRVAGFLPTERTTGLEPRGRDFCLGLLGSGGAVPGGMADSDLAAREQRIADRRLYLGNAPLPAWGPFLLDRRPRTKTFAGFASARLTLPLRDGGRAAHQKQNPHNMIEVKDLQSGDVIAVAQRPGERDPPA